ncbi:MAG: hypothetical protein Q8P18_01350 [Pseudomonadota bacterium]|nr:hypothetical protein [Pseudomonadota bacterium]
MLVSLLGCKPAPTLPVDPARGPSSGYYPVTIQLSDADPAAGEVARVTIGASPPTRWPPTGTRSR